ncbi:HTH domain-containing protein [Halosimplex aquaticum]|uniref:HTH domain-containing protein n=1 Tax=Halosimplex aquaticum TaxID=3026162 RepID=A0ABD5Y3R7_9EURY|nr:HTH domain-containing protein [Halosimplex aquaticum]
MTRDDTRPSGEPAFTRWLETTEDRFQRADTRRVTLFVRSMLPPLGAKGTQEALIRELNEHAAAGELDNVSVTVTGDRLCLCETCTGTDAGSSLLDRVRELDGWGREFDASVSRFFETRELDSSVAGETARALVPPRVAVALYCDGTLAGAFPCEMGDATVATRDFVAALNRFCEDASPSSDGKESLRVDSAPNSHS